MSPWPVVALGFAPFALLGLGDLIHSALARHRLRSRLRARRAADRRGPALPPAFTTPARALDSEWDREIPCLGDCADALRGQPCSHRRP